MEQIQDYYRYTQLMRAGFYDKLFFIDKLFHDWKSLLDYGCADGFQTKLIANVFPDKQIVGYDPDEDMINRAQFCGAMPANVRFSTQFTEYQTDVLYLSSVLHEVFSYREESGAFWAYLFNPTRKYVIIRDMMYDETEGSWSPDEEAKTALKRYVDRRLAGGELQRFKDLGYNPEGNYRDYMHFLLKLPYIGSRNWNREIAENYFPISLQGFARFIPEGWDYTYQEHYTLPYLQHWWQQELGLSVSMKTHAKLIIHRK